MNTIRWLAIFAALCAAGVGLADPPVDPALPTELVRVADDGDINTFLFTIGQQFPGVTLSSAIDTRRTYAISIPAVFDSRVFDTAMQTYVNPTPGTPDPQRPLVWAELNYAGRAPESRTGTIYVSRPTFNASQYRQQYAGAQLGLLAARLRASGRGVVVAVLDTGVDAAHAEFGGRVLTGYNFIDDSSDTRDINDFQDNDHDGIFDEATGHGTFAAGLISLTAPESLILPVVVLNSDGVGDAFVLAQGLYFAIDRGVDVIHLGLSSTYESQIVIDALYEARLHGIVVVAASGNQNSDEREFPACSEVPAFPGAPIGTDAPASFGVAAIDNVGVRAPFSNFNRRLAIAAPGRTFWNSLSPPDPDLTRSVVSTFPAGRYAVWEGTSVAAAFVSGAAALIRSQHPEWVLDYRLEGRVRSVLCASAVDIYPQNQQFQDDELGCGGLDVGSAVALGPPMPPRGDLNGDGWIGAADLGRFLADWHATHSPADFDGSGVVDESDLGVLLTSWTG